jgi:hypothetical protein
MSRAELIVSEVRIVRLATFIWTAFHGLSIELRLMCMFW